MYHKALDLQKHDKFEESAKAYHELLKTPLLKEVKGEYFFCKICIFSVNFQSKLILSPAGFRRHPQKIREWASSILD